MTLKYIFLLTFIGIMGCKEVLKTSNPLDYAVPNEPTYLGGNTYNTNALYPIKVQDKWGYIDKNGRSIVNPIYDSATAFNNNRSIVYFEGKYKFAYLLPSGKMMLPTHKGNSTSFYNGLSMIYDSNIKHLTVIDTIGKVLIDTILINCYDGNIDINNDTVSYQDNTGYTHQVFIPKIRHLSHGPKAIDYKKGAYNYTKYINTKGETLFEVKGKGYDFNFGIAYVDPNKASSRSVTNPQTTIREPSYKMYYIDSFGNKIKEIPFDGFEKRYKNGYFYIGGIGDAKGLLNEQGDTLLKQEYHYIIYAKQHTFIVKTGAKKRKFALYNAIKRRFVTDFEYDYMVSYGWSEFDNLIYAVRDKKMLYLNSDGDIVWREN